MPDKRTPAPSREIHLAAPVESAPVGEDGRLHAVAGPELGEYALDVGLDRRLLDHEGGGYLPVGEAPAEERKHLALPRGQLPEQAVVGRIQGGLPGRSLDHATRDRRGQKRVTGRDG